MKIAIRLSIALVCVSSLFAGSLKLKKEEGPSPLEQYIQQATTQGAAAKAQERAGSIWTPAARLGDLASDLRARSVNDMLVILVTDKASAAASGTTKRSGIPVRMQVSLSARTYQNSGRARQFVETAECDTTQRRWRDQSRDQLYDFLVRWRDASSANGFLVVEGAKTVSVNSENQLITVRGIVRPVDLTTGNSIQSDHIAQLEVRMNGKGVVGDAVKRPFFLYRLLLGLLPF